MRIYKWIGILAVAAGLWGCASNGTKEVAGGTVIPNLVNGNVLDVNSVPIEGARVTLQRIILTQNSDSVVDGRSTVTGADGRYSFDEVPKGKYVIFCEDSTGRLAAAIAKFNKWIDSSQVCQTMILRPMVTVCGRVLPDDSVLMNNLKVFIPGLTPRRDVDKNGVYILGRIPYGEFDVCFAEGNTVNLLPVSMNSSKGDTIYLSDALVDFTVGDISETYSFHESTFEYSNAILPRWYKPGYEPAWYKNKDFSRASYYSVVNGVCTKYAPAHTILLVMGSTYSWMSDYRIKTFLEKNMELSVFTKYETRIKATDTAGMDVIFCSSSMRSDTSFTLLKNTRIPVVVSEAYYFHDFAMTDSVALKDYGYASYNGYISIADPTHPIAGGMKDSVKVITSSGYHAWGKPVGDVKIVAYKKSLDSALIFCYEKGARMSGVQAPARRVGFFYDRTQYTVRTFTDQGWKIFGNTIMWAIEKP